MTQTRITIKRRIIEANAREILSIKKLKCFLFIKIERQTISNHIVCKLFSLSLSIKMSQPVRKSSRLAGKVATPQVIEPVIQSKPKPKPKSKPVWTPPPPRVYPPLGVPKDENEWLAYRAITGLFVGTRKVNEDADDDDQEWIFEPEEVSRAKLIAGFEAVGLKCQSIKFSQKNTHYGTYHCDCVVLYNKRMEDHAEFYLPDLTESAHMYEMKLEDPSVYFVPLEVLVIERV